MNNTAKIDRAIRLNVIGGGLMLGIAAVSTVLTASGLVSFGPRAVGWIALTAVCVAFALDRAKHASGSR
jgi:hypothetical protein